MDNLVGTTIKWKSGDNEFLIEGSNLVDYFIHHIGTKSYYNCSVKDIHEKINMGNILIVESSSKALNELNYEIY